MIELGAKVKCRVTGFTGIMTSRAEYFNGCVRCGVEKRVNKSGDLAKVEFFDEDQLEVVSGGLLKKKKKPVITGGPQRSDPQRGLDALR